MNAQPTNQMDWLKLGLIAVVCLLIYDRYKKPDVTDTLRQQLRAAWQQELSPAKKEQIAMLAALYRNAASQTAQNRDIKTLGQFQDVCKKAFSSVMPQGSLPFINDVVTAEQSRVIGTNPSQPMDEATRKAVADGFNKIATAAGELK